MQIFTCYQLNREKNVEANKNGNEMDGVLGHLMHI